MNPANAESTAVDHLIGVVERVTGAWLNGFPPSPHDLHDLTMATAMLRVVRIPVETDPTAVATLKRIMQL